MVSKIAIFTVAEAEAKMCGGPPAIAAAAYYRAGAAVDAPFHCISAECMNWRWYTTNIPGPTGDLEPNGETYGYCGLAGSPKPI